MKQGRTLETLAAELERQQEAKADYVADTRTLTLASNGDSKLSMVDIGTFGVNEIAHEQIGGRLRIPRKFYQRLRGDHPELLDRVVNELFQKEPEARMVRTLDGTARAFLSDRYRRLDNYDLAQVVLPILGEFPEMKIASCQLTDRRMYIKALFPRIEGEVAQGDVVQAGVVISNSEVGSGALKVEPLVFRLVCLNGMIVPDAGMRRFHIGRRVSEAEEAAYQLFRDETRKADDKAFFLKVEDVVRAAADEAAFRQTVATLSDLAEKPIEGDPVKSVEVLANEISLDEKEQGSVLRHLVNGGDLSQWGVVNAVTRASQDVDDYDRATEMEALGGTVAALEDRKWKAVATAGKE